LFRWFSGGGKLGEDALAAFGRRNALRSFSAAAPIREADKQHARNPDRPRAKREDGLEGDQARNQR
jgi:hypothetical protein